MGTVPGATPTGKVVWPTLRNGVGAVELVPEGATAGHCWEEEPMGIAWCSHTGACAAVAGCVFSGPACADAPASFAADPSSA